jgi:phage terminase Nu1 subunit (DNA packaging protein)
VRKWRQKKVNNLDGIIVGTSTLAKILDVTDRRVRQLVDEGIINKVKNGSYELIPTLKKYLLYIKTKSDNQIDNSHSEKDYQIEKTMHERAKRKIAELDLAQMQGKLHDATDIEREMTKMLAAFRAKILSIPSKIAPQLIAQSEISIIESILETEVYNALSELSEYDPELFQNDKYVGELELDEDQTEEN